MTPRPQRTIARSAEVRGFGLFGGQDVTLRFLPAPPSHGIAFQRVDLPGQPRVPALIPYVLPRPRRTAIGRGPAVIETIEHVMAALAGMQIDNCLVQLDALEPPAGDGSSAAFTAALQEAGIVMQALPRRTLRLTEDIVVRAPDSPGEIRLSPSDKEGLSLSAKVDYPGTSIGRQTCTASLSPDRFQQDIAAARTFILAEEVDRLRAQGYGRRVTTENVLVFGPDGPVDNQLRWPDECARHKLLDCIGDLALLGCDLCGAVEATQSGHALNHDVVRVLVQRLKANHRPRQAG